MGAPLSKKTSPKPKILATLFEARKDTKSSESFYNRE